MRTASRRQIQAWRLAVEIAWEKPPEGSLIRHHKTNNTRRRRAEIGRRWITVPDGRSPIRVYLFVAISYMSYLQ